MVDKENEIIRTQALGWNRIFGTPYITVSAKGITNGLSTIPNDGADFGPDSLQSDGILTQSGGFEEAWNYAYPRGMEIRILGNIVINKNVTLSAPLNSNGSFSIVGNGESSGFSINVSSGYGITVDPSVVNYGNIYLENLYFDNTGSADGAFKADFGTTNTGSNTAQLINLNEGSVNEWGDHGFYLNGFQNIVADQFQEYVISKNYDYIDAEFIAFSNSLMYHGISVGYVKGSANVFFTNTNCPGTILTHSTIFTLSFTNGYLESAFGVNNNVNVLAFTNSFYNSFSSGGYFVNSNTAATIGVLIIENISGILYNNQTIYNSTYLTVNNLQYRNVNLNLNGYTLTLQALSPTLSANPPASATVYQNTNSYDIVIDLPVYATTAGTAGTVAYGVSTTSTVTEMTPRYVNGATSSTAVDIVSVRVPAGWYYEFTGSGVTFGTAVVTAV